MKCSLCNDIIEGLDFIDLEGECWHDECYMEYTGVEPQELAYMKGEG